MNWKLTTLIHELETSLNINRLQNEEQKWRKTQEKITNNQCKNIWNEHNSLENEIWK